MKEAGLYPYIWLNMVDLCQKLTKRKTEELRLVKYFTAVTSSHEGRRKRHLRFIEALKTTEPYIEIYEGKFYRTSEWCRKCGNNYYIYREKRTDVNIASHLINDAVDNVFDVAYLVTGDSDLVPALEIAKQRNSKKKYGVWFPPKRYSFDLKRITDFYKTIPDNIIKNSQFPDPVEDAGKKINKPERWR